jgi:glutathione S-transferase
MRPIWVAEELGVPYLLKPIGPRTGETQSPEYTRLSPKQKIPLLIDGSLHLSESVAICRYLIENYPAEAIKFPTTAVDRAREDEWCCYLYGELDETSLYVMRRHGDLGQIYGAAPAVVSAAAAYATRQLNVIAIQMQDREFVMDFGFGLADVLLTSCLDWSVAYDIELPGGLEDYRLNISKREAFRRAVSINYQTSAGRI